MKSEKGLGPKCPRCHLDTFDDWWHDKTFRMAGMILRGRIRCHGCGVFFRVERHPDGVVFSTMRKTKKSPCKVKDLKRYEEMETKK